MAGASQYMFGSGLVYGTRNDTTGNTPRLFGTLQDVSIDFDGEIKDLFGQFQFPVDTARGKTKVTGKAKFATVSGEIFNDIFFGQTLTEGQTSFAYNEAETLPEVVTASTSAATSSGDTLTFSAVPAGVLVGSLVIDKTTSDVIPTGTYVTAKSSTTVTISKPVTGGGVLSADEIDFGPVYVVANASDTPLTDNGVTYQNTGAALQLDAEIDYSGTAGTYNFLASSGSYQFTAADAGASVFVNYLYTQSENGTLITLNNPFMGTTPRFQIVFTEQFEEQQVVFTLLSCVSSKLMFQTKIDDYTIPEMDFSAFANAAGALGTLAFAN